MAVDYVPLPEGGISTRLLAALVTYSISKVSLLDALVTYSISRVSLLAALVTYLIRRTRLNQRRATSVVTLSG